jgi:hypothetical protein
MLKAKGKKQKAIEMRKDIGWCRVGAGGVVVKRS